MASQKSDKLMISCSLLTSFSVLARTPIPSSSLHPMAPRHAPSIQHCLRQQLAKDGDKEASSGLPMDPSAPLPQLSPTDSQPEGGSQAGKGSYGLGALCLVDY